MLPSMIPIRQRFPASGLGDVEGAVLGAMKALGLDRRIKPGSTVGLPVGSRGIRNIAVILRAAVGYLRTLGAQPVLVSAMGSHGGGTAAGQLQVLSSLGITEGTVGAPVLGTEESIVLAGTAAGEPIFFDRFLADCDGLLLINRIKPHTSFRGPLESGLVKMLVVGCGKAKGARQFHRYGSAELSGRLREVGGTLLTRLPLLGGIGILENQREQTHAVVPVAPAELIRREEELLEQARRLQPRIPVDELDLLVVDRMGKEYAGTGMDTNVIGRLGIRGLPDPPPRIGRIVVLDLSEASHGNANGMGLADVVTRRLANKIDFRATYLNTLTATFVERAMLPIVMESDREAILAALRTLGEPVEPRILRIPNTLELEELLVSHAVADELRNRADVEVIGPPAPWRFDGRGDLL